MQEWSDQDKLPFTEVQESRLNAEVGFQRSKQMKNQIEAYLDRVLVDSEVQPGLRDQAQAFLQNQARNMDQRKKDEARMLKLMSPLPPDVDFGTHKFFLEETAWMNSTGFPRGLTLVTDPWKADVFVAKDPASPSRGILWHAALGGGHVVTLPFLQSRGQGLCFTYGTAILTKRFIFIDPVFEQEEQEIAMAVRRMAHSGRSKWSLLRSWEDFARKTDMVAGVHLPAQQRRHLEVLALTTDRVAKALARKNVRTQATFLLAVTRVACTQRGI